MESTDHSSDSDLEGEADEGNPYADLEGAVLHDVAPEGHEVADFWGEEGGEEEDPSHFDPDPDVDALPDPPPPQATPAESGLDPADPLAGPMSSRGPEPGPTP